MTSPALDNQLCFALYATSRLVAAAYRPFLDRMGVTYPQVPGSSMKQLCARLINDLVRRLAETTRLRTGCIPGNKHENL